jgi:hypothetical protein
MPRLSLKVLRLMRVSNTQRCAALLLLMLEAVTTDLVSPSA